MFSNCLKCGLPHFLDNIPPSCRGQVPGVSHAAGSSPMCQLRPQEPQCPPDVDLWRGAQTLGLGRDRKARASPSTLWLNSGILCLSNRYVLVLQDCICLK